MAKFLFIKKDGRYTKILFSDIVYVENAKRYARLVTLKKTYLVYLSLCNVAKELPTDIFCRIHQSYIVSLEHLEGFDNEVASIANRQLPIGRQYKKILLEKIGVLNCDAGNKRKFFKGGIDELINEVKPN